MKVRTKSLEARIRNLVCTYEAPFTLDYKYNIHSSGYDRDEIQAVS